jgi:hypothetical protein
MSNKLRDSFGAFPGARDVEAETDACREACCVVYGMIWEMSYERQMFFFGDSFHWVSSQLAAVVSGDTTIPGSIPRLRRLLLSAQQQGLGFPSGILDSIKSI